jgi:hypothetical protein
VSVCDPSTVSVPKPLDRLSKYNIRYSLLLVTNKGLLYLFSATSNYTTDVTR